MKKNKESFDEEIRWKMLQAADVDARVAAKKKERDALNESNSQRKLQIAQSVKCEENIKKRIARVELKDLKEAPVQ